MGRDGRMAKRTPGKRVPLRDSGFKSQSRRSIDCLTPNVTASYEVHDGYRNSDPIAMSVGGFTIIVEIGMPLEPIIVIKTSVLLFILVFGLIDICSSFFGSPVFGSSGAYSLSFVSLSVHPMPVATTISRFRSGTCGRHRWSTSRRSW